MADQERGIGRFFRQTLGASFKNTPWSWGAINPKTGTLFLRVWADEMRRVDGVDAVQVLGSDWSGSSPGYAERVEHVGLMRRGTVAYGVLCVMQEATSPGPRKIAHFERESLLVLGYLFERSGSVHAAITGSVSVSSVDQSIGIPKEVTSGDVTNALRKLATGAPHPFGVSTGWDVVFEGKGYPQKAVLGLAGERLAGRPMGPYDFTAGECRRVLTELGYPPVQKLVEDDSRETDENTVESAIRDRTDIDSTEKDQLIKARRGQGAFRANLQRIEKRCRVTGIKDPVYLRASHIKLWCRCDDRERLDGNNELLLSPHVDHLFDGGFITFTDSGDLIPADALKDGVLKTWGIALPLNVQRFRPNRLCISPIIAAWCF